MKKKLLAFMLAAGLILTGSAYFPQTALAARQSDAGSASDDIHAQIKRFAGNGTKQNRVGSSNSVKGSTYWDKFAGHTYYDQLSSDDRALYDKLKKLADKYLNGTASAQRQSLSDGSTGYYTDTISYKSMDVNEVFSVATLFCFENPQYYFLNDGIAYTPSDDTFYSYLFDEPGDGTVALGVYSKYAKASARKTYTSQYKKDIENYLDGAAAYSDDLAKETYFHDRLAGEVSYNNNTTDYNEDSTESQSASSVFFYKNTVCAGYSKAMSLLLNAEGINNVAVTSSSHAWNEVKINGRWYITDVTWDVANPVSHSFFNISETEMDRRDQEWAHVPLDFYSSIRPACTTAHTSAVDAADLTSATKNNTGSEDTTDTENTTGEDAGRSTTPSINQTPKVISVKKPVKPSVFTVKRVKKGTLKITLKTKKKVSGFYILYRVKGTKIWDVKWISVNGKSKTFKISGLRKGKKYQIRAYSTDKDGILSKGTKTKTVKA